MLTQSQPERIALRITDASVASGLCKTKLYDLINDGTLKTIKIGRARLIIKTSLEELLTPAKAA